MYSPTQDPEPNIIVQWIDLEGIPLDTLRNLKNPLLSQSLQFVATQLKRPSKTETSCSNLAAQF